MVDIENAVFDNVATRFTALYPNGSRYGEPTESPPAFPCLSMYQYDKFFSGYVGLDSNRVVIDVDVFSNLVSGAKQECKAIMEMVDEEMMSVGSWELVFCNQLKNADQRIFRMKARYRGTAVEELPDGDNKNVRIYRR